MALYIGNDKKRKINLNGVTYCLNLFTTTPITNGTRMMSSDGYILKDSKGLFITTKEVK